FDQRLLRPNEGDRAIRLAPADVAGVEPSTSEPVGVECLPIVVAGHDHRPSYDDLAGLAGRELAVLVIDNAYLRDGDRPARVTCRGPADSTKRDQSGDLGLAVASAPPRARIHARGQHVPRVGIARWPQAREIESSLPIHLAYLADLGRH